jgi:hypothetical protein
MQTAFITRKQLDEAIELQAQAQEGRIGEWLQRLGFVEEHQITAALARQYGLPLINLNLADANTAAVRMIPGKVARYSGLVPVGFDGDQKSVRVAVTAPVNFNLQEAIRRMVGTGVIPFIGDQSVIQKMMEKLYGPEELDLSNLPTFDSLNDLIEISKQIIATAINYEANDIRAELMQDLFWVRLDLPAESHHHLFRHQAVQGGIYEQTQGKGMAVGFGAG